eukprot:TRINITY_DN4439_c0_g1_i1.p1 TRINITY_DN4439_c0_g1~~TRINITY_DN4439_c0_g1_i1.p1  ORF type:complete len:290 (+),score=115.71 TRINITY_DN4439_c0_g1_i1:19-888(+)
MIYFVDFLFYFFSLLLFFLLLFVHFFSFFLFFFFFFKQKTAYEMLRSLVGSEMCIRDSHKLIKDGRKTTAEEQFGPFNDEHDAVVLGRGWGKKRVKCGELSMMFTITTTSDKPSDKIEPTDLIARNAVKYVCRVYLMSCSHLAAKDNSIFGSASDPYPVFILSDGSENNDKKKIVKMKCADDRKYQTLNPEYFIMRELSGELPQHGNLRVEIFDWDRIGSDELIGYTDINLEDRWFSCRGYPERRESTLAPGSYTEKRTLVDPQGQAQGRIEMWAVSYTHLTLPTKRIV